jgi:hypothetical protein
VEEHLAVCADCRELLGDFRASQAAVKELGSEAVDAALLTAVRAGVLARIDDRRRAVWPWVAAATAALAAALALLAVLTPARRPVTERRPVAMAQAPPRAQEPPNPPAAGHRPAVRRARRLPSAKRPAPPLVVKMYTDDPDIVIIWLVDQTGD